MNKKLQILIVVILLIETTFIAYKLSDFGSSAASKVSLSMYPINPKKNEDKYLSYKSSKPYLFLKKAELEDFDCDKLTKTEDKKECSDLKIRTEIADDFGSKSLEQIKNIDCTKHIDPAEIKECEDAKEFILKHAKKPSKISSRKRIPKTTDSGSVR